MQQQEEKDAKKGLGKCGNWRVYDVMIEGVGLVTNYRGQFDEILSRSSFDDLLRQLREKVAQS
ncbi:MAG: ABC transporter substrate-binding protein [Syntrophobacteraceae bacterium]